MVRSQTRVRVFPQNTYTGSEAHPISYSLGKGEAFPGDKMAVAWSWPAWGKLQLCSHLWLHGRRTNNFPLHLKSLSSRWQNDSERMNCFVKKETRALRVVYWLFLCDWGRKINVLKQSVSRQCVASSVARHFATDMWDPAPKARASLWPMQSTWMEVQMYPVPLPFYSRLLRDWNAK